MIGLHMMRLEIDIFGKSKQVRTRKILQHARGELDPIAPETLVVGFKSWFYIQEAGFWRVIFEMIACAIVQKVFVR